MKKFLLLILIAGFAVTSFGQFRAAKVPEHLQNKRLRVPELVPGLPGVSQSSIIPGAKDDDYIIGNTIHDLQSYNGLQQRVFAYDDGTIGATWMRAVEPDWSDRGSAYAFYDGNDWSDPTNHIESVRTGWPCYAPYGPNGEIIVSHYSDAGGIFGLLFAKRDQKGQGEWVEFTLAGPEGFSIVWPAMVTAGEDNMIIHVLARTWGDPYEEMDGAPLYYRSLDGGESWDIEHELLDDINSNYFSGVGGDGYSWADPKGETIAFSIGFHAEDGYVMKSFDNGDNWEKIVVYESPYSPYPGGATPLYGAGDETQGVAIDSEGDVHMVFGRMMYEYDEEGALYYVPAAEGMIYWNESMDFLDSTIISTYTLDYLEEGGYLIGWTIPYQGDSSIVDFFTYGVGLTSHPQINIDDDDNIYVIYMAVAPGFTNIDYNYRHICGNGSNDGGASWTGPKDYTNSMLFIFSECVYPAMSPNFPDNMVRFTFQEDAQPGIHIWLEDHEPTDNNIHFMEVDKDNFIVGIDDPAGATVRDHEVLPAYPNPFREATTILVGLKAPSEVRISIMNIAGQLIYSQDYGKVTSDMLSIELDGNDFTEGVYFYTISVDGMAYTGKLLKH